MDQANVVKPAAPATPAPQSLSERDAASYITVSYSTLKSSRRSGPIPGRMTAPPHVRLGRSIRYRIADLDAYLAANRVGGMQ